MIDNYKNIEINLKLGMNGCFKMYSNLSQDYTIEELQNCIEKDLKIEIGDLLLFNDSGTQLEPEMVLSTVFEDVEKKEMNHTSRGIGDGQNLASKSSRVELKSSGLGLQKELVSVFFLNSH